MGTGGGKEPTPSTPTRLHLRELGNEREQMRQPVLVHLMGASAGRGRKGREVCGFKRLRSTYMLGNYRGVNRKRDLK